MNKTYISLVFILLTVILIISGCDIAQENNDGKVADLEAEVASLQSDLDAAQAEVASLQSDLDTAIGEKEGLQIELKEAIDDKDDLTEVLITTINEKDALQNKLDAAIDERDIWITEIITSRDAKDTLQNELDTIKSVYPPGEFDSFDEFKNWVSTHKQPSTGDLGSLFRAALEVQQLGLQDGYLISVVYDEDYGGPGYPRVFNGTLANGSFYVWDPGTGNIYYWYSDIL